MIASHGNQPLPVVDWDEWDKTLMQFSAASSLVVSAYDANGVRQLGPYLPTRLANLLASSTLWDSAGPGVLFEQSLIARSHESGKAESARFGDELLVKAVPLTLLGNAQGFVVFGWNFSSFTSSRACENIARQIGMAGPKLWMEARLHSPVPEPRMAIYSELLHTLIGAATRQAESLARINQIARAREIFLATVSHEMRTPLAAILLRLEILLYGKLDDPIELRKALTAMLANVHQESQLVEDLIDAAQTLTGNLKINPRKVSLHQILLAALSTVGQRAEMKNVRIVLQSAAEDGMQVWGDGQRLEQVFWNLIFNAIKFTPSGGEITVSVTSRDEALEVEVRDTGEGISENQLASIFDAFSKQSVNNDQGLGLGLFIVKHIIELHGGLIRAKSDGLGQGTSFTVVLPRRFPLSDAPVPAHPRPVAEG